MSESIRVREREFSEKGERGEEVALCMVKRSDALVSHNSPTPYFFVHAPL